MGDFRFPDNSQRTAVMGRTGSGKTQFGIWLLSHMDFTSQPWVVFDFKGDALINEIPYAKNIALDKVISDPGIYVVRPRPGDDEAVDVFLERIWEQEHVGIFIDEAYCIDKNSDAFNAILTQGRSKHIPAIILTQRPAWISRFVFSESDFFAIFHLNDKKDRDRVAQFLPDPNEQEQADLEQRLQKYHSLWFDVGEHRIFPLLPVPDRASIIARFEERLRTLENEKPVKKRFI